MNHPETLREKARRLADLLLGFRDTFELIRVLNQSTIPSFLDSDQWTLTEGEILQLLQAPVCDHGIEPVGECYDCARLAIQAAFIENLSDYAGANLDDATVEALAVAVQYEVDHRR